MIHAHTHHQHHTPESPPKADPPSGEDRIVSGVELTCPMHPEVRQREPGTCPKCGMALEPVAPVAPRNEYVCPMHPQIVRTQPGACPICGMALEPRTTTTQAEDNPELDSMWRRFWVSALLTIPVFAVAMAEMIPGQPVHHQEP